jgi:hypothetical protein
MNNLVKLRPIKFGMSPNTFNAIGFTCAMRRSASTRYTPSGA